MGYINNNPSKQHKYQQFEKHISNTSHTNISARNEAGGNGENNLNTFKR